MKKKIANAALVSLTRDGFACDGFNHISLPSKELAKCKTALHYTNNLVYDMLVSSGDHDVKVAFCFIRDVRTIRSWKDMNNYVEVLFKNLNEMV